MKISELIERLEEIKKEHGDINVAIQYRDSGGDYWGCDADLRFSIADAVSADMTVKRDGHIVTENQEILNVLIL